MRVAPETRYDELRDALANDWAEFMAFALPEALWMAIPNLGLDVPRYVESWALDAIILTGGNDIREFQHKDDTDRALLQYALDHDVPLLGVCRGLQVLAHHSGIELEPCSAADHVATRHNVEILNGRWDGLADNGLLEVNSFHQYGIRQQDVGTALELLAVCDGWVEAAAMPRSHVVGVMWHPERGRPFRDIDRLIIRDTFKEVL